MSKPQCNARSSFIYYRRRTDTYANRQNTYEIHQTSSPTPNRGNGMNTNKGCNAWMKRAPFSHTIAHAYYM